MSLSLEQLEEASLAVRAAIDILEWAEEDSELKKAATDLEEVESVIDTIIANEEY